jgi:hypothetical protein
MRTEYFSNAKVYVAKNILCANVFFNYYYVQLLFLYAKNKLCG